MKKIVLSLLIIPVFVFAAIVKFENLQPSYFPKQIVNLKIKIILSKENNLSVIAPKNFEANLTKTNPYLYNLKLRFQAKDANNSVIIIGKNLYYDLNLTNKIKYKHLTQQPENFSGVFAKSLFVKNAIASKYGKNTAIISFIIKCKQCNIKDFSLPVKEQNLTIVSNNEASYYAVIPKYEKNFDFYYYDLNQQTFKKIKIPVILKEQTICTQTNINPQNRKIFTPLNILTLILIAFLIIVFLVYQRIWLLIFPIVVSILFALQFLPKGKVILKPHAIIRILPTRQSTVIYETNKSVKVDVLNSIPGYTKIKIKNKIGWVNDIYVNK
jgi:hypothetical protein